MHNPDHVRVKKTAKLDQRKLSVIARRFGIAPISVRELQLGYAEDIPAAAATRLEQAGLVQRVKTKPRSMQRRLDSQTTITPEDTIVPEPDDTTLVVAPEDGTTSDPDTTEDGTDV